MKKYLWFTAVLLISTLSVTSIFASQSNASFELEVVKADMKEAGPQYAAALVQYPQAAPKVYALYGQTPELQAVFQKYGHNQIVPIIEKCLDEGDTLLELGTQFDELMSSPLNKLEVSKVEPAECGWRAVLITLIAGNNFLGQYVIDDAGKAHVLPGASALAIMKRLTTSGLQAFEKRLVLGETPTSKEWGLAALDVAAIGLTGKVIATAVRKNLVRASRPTLSYKLIHCPNGLGRVCDSLCARIAKFATIGGVAYLAVYHPRVINGAAAVIADALGSHHFLCRYLSGG